METIDAPKKLRSGKEDVVQGTAGAWVVLFDIVAETLLGLAKRRFPRGHVEFHSTRLLKKP